MGEATAADGAPGKQSLNSLCISTNRPEGRHILQKERSEVDVGVPKLARCSL